MDKISGKVLLHGKLKDGLYGIRLPSVSSVSSRCQNKSSFLATIGQENKSVICFNSNLSSTQLWHFRLGHPSSLIQNKVFQQCKTPISINTSCTNFCSSCQLGKVHRLYAPPSVTKSSEPLELILSDVWGPAPVESRDGFKYYIIF